MAKVVLPPVTGGNNIQRMNDNFSLIADALNNGALWRDNPEDEPNEMINDLDMNGQRVYNLPRPFLDHEAARLQDIREIGGAPFSYFGPLEEDPTTRPDGSALVEGDSYYNTVLNQVRYWNGGSWFTPNVDGQQLQLPTGSQYVGFIQDFPEAVATSVLTKMRENSLSPLDFGAVGDGVTDDADALRKTIQAAIDSGLSVHLQSSKYKYRIASELVFSVTDKVVYIVSEGAQIVCDFPTHRKSAIEFITIGGSVITEGGLYIDVARKANVGFHVHNDQAYDDPLLRRTAVRIEDLTVENAYRLNTDFLISAGGVEVRGAMSTVDINRVRVNNTALAPTAGVSGSYGAHALSVLNLSAVSYLACRITNCDFDKVYCEDASYTLDQDGIRAYDAGERVFNLNPWPTITIVDNCSFRNCYGRSIKIQSQICQISNISLFRNEGFSTFIGNYEIDLQTGGGSVDGVQFLYTNNHVPNRIVHFASGRSSGRKVNHSYANNIYGVIDGTTPLNYMVAHAQFSTDRMDLTINNLSCTGGSINYFTRIDNRIEDSTFRMSNFMGNCLEGAILSVNSGGVDSVTRVLADKIVQNGAVVPFHVRQNSTSRVLVSAVNSLGWMAQRRMSDEDPTSQPAYTRVHAIGAWNNINSGLFTPMAFRIAPGVTQVLPQTTYNGFAGLLIVSIAHIRATQGIFSASSEGVLKVAGIGENIEVGGTTEPVTGAWKMWYNGTGIAIKNNTADIRTVTVWSFG